MADVVRCFGCGKRLRHDERNQLYDPEPDAQGNLHPVDEYGCNAYPDCIDDGGEN